MHWYDRILRHQLELHAITSELGSLLCVFEHAFKSWQAYCIRCHKYEFMWWVASWFVWSFFTTVRVSTTSAHFFIYTSTALTKVCFLYTRLCLISISNDTSIATSARRVLRIKTWESSLPHSMLQLLGFLDEWPVALTGLLQARRRKNDARRSWGFGVLRRHWIFD